MNIAVIGYGYWGPNLVRNFFAIENSKVLMVADPRSERLKIVNSIFPSIQTTENVADVFNNANVMLC